jgi:hypothetical protein
MWVHDGVRVLLLYDDGEVERETLIPNTIWSEIKGVGSVVEEQEWWVLLVGHAVDVDLWFIIAFWVRKLWKFVLVDITNSELPGGLDIGNEVRVVVVEDLNIKIELDKLIESRATSQDCSSLTDGIFTGSVDVKGYHLCRILPIYRGMDQLRYRFGRARFDPCPSWRRHQ